MIDIWADLTISSDDHFEIRDFMTLRLSRGHTRSKALPDAAASEGVKRLKKQNKR